MPGGEARVNSFVSQVNENRDGSAALFDFRQSAPNSGQCEEKLPRQPMHCLPACQSLPLHARHSHVAVRHRHSNICSAAYRPYLKPVWVQHDGTRRDVQRRAPIREWIFRGLQSVACRYPTNVNDTFSMQNEPPSHIPAFNHWRFLVRHPCGGGGGGMRACGGGGACPASALDDIVHKTRL